MTSMQNAAVRAGLVSEADVHRVERDKEREERRRLKKERRERALKEFASLSSISMFTVNAMIELENDPTLIGSVIGLAHRFKHHAGGKKLIWTLYQIRNQFPTISKEERGIFLKKWLEELC